MTNLPPIYTHVLKNIHDGKVQIAMKAYNKMENEIPDLALQLLFIAKHEKASFSDKHLAVLALKDYIKDHWNPKSEKLLGPKERLMRPIPSKYKPQIRTDLQNLLVKQSNQLLTSAYALAISQIAHHDYPQDWPELLDWLVHCTQQYQNPHVIQGAIETLGLCIRFCHTSRAKRLIPQIGKLLLPIYQDQKIQFSVRCHVIEVLDGIFQLLSMLVLSEEEYCNSVLNRFYEDWFPVFNAELTKPINPTEDFTIRIRIVHLIESTIFNFWNRLPSKIHKLLNPVKNHFIKGADIYFSSFCVKNILSGQSTESRILPGYRCDYPIFCDAIVNLLATLFEQPEFEKLFLEQQHQIIYTLLKYMCYPYDHTIMSRDSPFKFSILDSQRNIRTSSAELLYEMVSTFGESTITAFSQVVKRSFLETDNFLKEGQKDQWWRRREALHYAVSSIDTPLEFIDDLGEQEMKDIFSLPFYLSKILPKDVNKSYPVLLLCTVIRSAGTFATHLDDATAQGFFTISCSCVQSAPMILKIAATRAIRQLVPICEPTNPQKVIPDLVFNLLKLSTTPLFDMELLTCLAAVIAKYPLSISKHIQMFVDKLVKTWFKHYDDSTVMDLISECLCALLKHKSYRSSLVSLEKSLYQRFVEYKKAPNNREKIQMCLSSFEILEDFIQAGTNQAFLERFAPILFDLAFNSENSEIYEGATFQLRNLIWSIAFPQVLTLKIDNKGLFQPLVKLVEHQLSSKILTFSNQVTDATVDLCCLVFRMILKGKKQNIDSQLIQNLESANDYILFLVVQAFCFILRNKIHTPTIVTPLLRYFSYYAIFNTKKFVTTLSSPEFNKKIGKTPYTHALHLVMHLWTKFHQDISSNHGRNLSLLGFEKLWPLTLNQKLMPLDPKSNTHPFNFLVQGDQNLKQLPQERASRSKTRASKANIDVWSKIPLGVKIWKIFMADWYHRAVDLSAKLKGAQVYSKKLANVYQSASSELEAFYNTAGPGSTDMLLEQSSLQDAVDDADFVERSRLLFFTSDPFFKFDASKWLVTFCGEHISKWSSDDSKAFYNSCSINEQSAMKTLRMNNGTSVASKLLSVTQSLRQTNT